MGDLDTPLTERLRDRIKTDGPLPVSVFMAEALFDPVHGYYAAKDPLSAGEDFITAPEISQIFGELIGLWAVQTWMDMDRPTQFHLIELGPGTGALMSDMLRAGRAAPGYLEALRVTLVEVGAALKMVQGRRLADSPAPLSWVDRIEAAPAGPAAIVANEFLDCLPIRQAVRAGGRWRERCVGLSPDDPDRFAFVLGPALGPDEALIAPEARDAPEGSLAELRPGDIQIVDALKDRFTAHSGRALFIDYGSARSAVGDTLQALKGHEKRDPLEGPGHYDLTAHVDFAALKRLGAMAGLAVYGPTPQRDFLLSLGLETRAAALAAANPANRATLARQVWRLTDPDQMGRLFKVIAFSSRDLPDPPGF